MGKKHHFTNLGPLGAQWALGPKISDVMVFGPRKREIGRGRRREEREGRGGRATLKELGEGRRVEKRRIGEGRKQERNRKEEQVKEKEGPRIDSVLSASLTEDG